MSSILFKPILLGTLELKNRIVMPSIATNYGDGNGFVTRRSIDHYTRCARGGTGLIITEVVSIAPTGKGFANQLGIYKDDFIPQLKQLTGAVKKIGTAKFILQLHHAGRRASPQVNNGAQPVAPSALACTGGEMPHILTTEEIEELIEAFSQGARRAKEAGFDGVEVHCAHGYLIQQFLSPLTNKRTDKYGGDFESRARFALEILKHIRNRVGKEYTLLVKICGSEFFNGGINLRSSQKLVTLFEEAHITGIEVSGGYKASSEEGYLNSPVPMANLSMASPRGYFIHLAEGIKKVTALPVIAVGRLNEPELAEKIITEGKADLVAIGRGLIADPLFPSRVQKGRVSDIRPCISCNTCANNLVGAASLECTVNAELGSGSDFRIVPASVPRKVLIVGGGPGGMEAARVAALRGHKVTLVERKPYLGGNLVAAAAVSFKKEIGRLTEYLSGQVKKAGADIRLGYELDENNIFAFNPEVIVLATGALCQKPGIPGIERRNVTDAVEVLEGNIDTGTRVVVVGGGMIGCEAAVFLAEKGKQVTLVTRRSPDFSTTGGLAPDMEASMRRWFLFELWQDLPIEIVANSTFKEVSNDGLIVEGREGDTRLVKGDTVVFAAGMSANNALGKKLEGKISEIYQIGDCVQPRKIINAIQEGNRVAYLI